jgi:hypothetical protein
MKKLRIVILRFGRKGSLMMDKSKINPSNPFGIVPLSNFVPRGFGFVHHSIKPFSTRSAKPLSHDSQLFHRGRRAAAAAATGAWSSTSPRSRPPPTPSSRVCV